MPATRCSTRARLCPSPSTPIPGTFALVITGPNTGGKTVTLKTVGLLAVMAQSGLHIPAQSGSELPCFQAIYADIGDEQSIEQSLSTFSGHITNIVHILKKADRRSLVILDELGAGTDPQEGRCPGACHPLPPAAGGHHHLRRHPLPGTEDLRPHHPRCGQCLAGVQRPDAAPTYKLTIGLPGRSNALAIAQRLGLPQEIIEAARARSTRTTCAPTS